MMVSGPPRWTRRNGAQNARRSDMGLFLLFWSLDLVYWLLEMSPTAKLAAASASR